MNKRYFKLCLAVIFVITLFLGCSFHKNQSPSDNTDKDKKTIKMAYVDWSENIAMANLMKYILEEEMGYTVKLKQYNISTAFEAIAKSKEDIFMDVWLPTTHESYYKQYKDKIEDIGINYEGAKIGLVVPTYVNINSIDDVNQISNEVNNEIVGINSQAGIMEKTNLAIETYKLDFTLKEGNEDEMIHQLQSAIQENKPIIITGWSPHWMFSKWNLKFLDDPSLAYGHVENIHTIGRINFTKDMPQASKVLANFNLDSEQLDNLMEDIENRDATVTISEICRSWVENHKELVDSWITN